MPQLKYKENNKMSDFPLIKSLQTKNEKTPLPSGRQYTKFKVVVEGEEMIVHIPVKESKKFEAILEGSDNMDKYNFNEIMRDLRGIRG